MSTQPCKWCGRGIELRHAATTNDGTPLYRWCHDRTYGAPTAHCPTGGDGSTRNPSRDHEPEDQP